MTMGFIFEVSSVNANNSEKWKVCVAAKLEFYSLQMLCFTHLSPCLSRAVMLSHFWCE